MPQNDHCCRDIDDCARAIIGFSLPGRMGQRGGIAEYDRRFVNAVFLVLRIGSSWRDLLPDCGGRKNVHLRFCRRGDKGGWERLLEAVIGDPDFEWLMTGATYVEARRSGTGICGGSEGAGCTKGSSMPRCTWPWMRMVCRSDSSLREVSRRTAALRPRLSAASRPASCSRVAPTASTGRSPRPPGLGRMRLSPPSRAARCRGEPACAYSV